MTELAPRSNPYVGLRPFFERDSLYFFGRGQQTAELLEILHQQRFLGIVGSSGSGKSSLLRAGVLPKLHGGFLAHDRDRWRIVKMKPGDAPLVNLAAALLDAMAPAFTPDDQAALAQRLRDDHTDALIAFLDARLESTANLFVLVDQFEEIFAFRGAQDDEGAAIADGGRRQERARRKAEAADFVDLLLDLSRRRHLPIYVALTMRTDFLGECDLFYGMPEALNRGRYLVPRLTRQQLREAIEGPALLLGARLEPRLVDYLLNELGDRFDRLPVLQHALLRTWDAWQQAGSVGPIDFPHYDAAGRLDQALDRDAESAMAGLDPGVTAAIFKRLTATDVNARRVRSPARVSQLMASAAADRGTVDGIVHRFQESGRSFLYTADDGTPDDPRVDIAHESLIRQWTRLRQWVDDERRARDQYTELAVRARKRERGEAALLQDPELRTIADWRDRSHPSGPWAARYSAADGDFESAIAYLDASIDAQSHARAEAELSRRWKIWNAIILLIVLTLAVMSETWFADRPGTGTVDRVEGPSASVPASAVVATARIGGLDWTIDDRGRALDWNAAAASCDDLIVGSRSEWRLPTTGELLDIYDPAAVSADGLKIEKPFHAGVRSRWIWSDTAGETASTALAADFTGGMFVPVPIDAAAGVRALCVMSPASAETAQTAVGARVVEAFRTYRPLGTFVLAYLMLAWVGKRIHRRLAFPRMLRTFVAAGGRNPDEIATSEEPPQDAPAVHHTTYASTIRRVAGYWIDTALYLSCVLLVFAVLIIVADVPVVVTLPSGERIEGMFDDMDDQTVSLTTADGTLRSFPVNRGPSLDVIDGVAVAGTLPSGARVEGRSFDRLQVVVTLPSEERIEGTLVARAADGVTIRMANGETRSIALDPNAPDVEIFWPPSNAGLGWCLLFCLVFGWLYETLQLSSTRQATVGMRAVGIFRTDLNGRRLSFGRASAWYGYRLLSYLAYLLGFASQPFTKRRQTFHDWMAASVVLRRAKADPDRK